MRTVLLMSALLAHSGAALAQDTEDPEGSEAEEDEASEFSYVSDAKERPWKDIYRQGWASSTGGTIGAWVGLGGVGVGLALAGPTGCAPGDTGVCTQSYLGDGFMTFGAIISHGSVLAQNVGALKARRALKQSGTATVSALPGTVGLVMWLGAAGTIAGWIDFARPTEALPAFPIVGNRSVMVADHILLATAWGFGFAQQHIVSKHRAEMLPQLDAKVNLQLSPEVGKEYAGLRLGAIW